MHLQSNYIKYVLLLVVYFLCSSQVSDFDNIHIIGRWDMGINCYQGDVMIHPTESLVDEGWLTALQDAGTTWNNESTNLQFDVQNSGIDNDRIYWRNDLINAVGIDVDMEVYGDAGIWEAANTRIEYRDNSTDCAISATGPEIIEADVVINWWPPFQHGCAKLHDSKYDIQSTLTHELGHVAGIHHFSSGRAMFPKQNKTTDICKLRTINQADRDNLLYLYGLDDETSTCYAIDCEEYDLTGVDPLKLKEPLFTCDGNNGCGNNGNGCDCTCNGGCKQHPRLDELNQWISEPAQRNIIVFATTELDGNFPAMQHLIIDHRDIFAYVLGDICLNEFPLSAELKKILIDCISVNAPLVDAAFRCESNFGRSDLVIETYHIEALHELIDIVIASINKSEEPRDLKRKTDKYLGRLKQVLPFVEGMSVQEAALFYDQYEFIN